MPEPEPASPEHQEPKLPPWKQFWEDLSWDIPTARAFGNLLLGFSTAEGKAVKNGCFAILVIACAVGYFAYNAGYKKGWRDMEELRTDKMVDKLQHLSPNQRQKEYDEMLAEHGGNASELLADGMAAFRNEDYSETIR